MNAELFEREPDTATFPPPRPFQEVAHTKLREGFRNRFKNQLLVAPTGSGKTVIGLRIIYEALRKGRRGLFVCDRTALINQTSARADEYGLKNHGIVQANHWRRDNALPFQIASIQTIQSRGYWPSADVIVLDEAHTLYSATRELLKTSDAAIIGLTATPCTKDLGNFYGHIINAATMHELTESGVLVPMKILDCVSPDMTGAKTNSLGEWTTAAASEREMTIIGDVVAEWIKHGEDRKTIAFGPDIAYCEQLVQRFNRAGVSAELYTSETPDDERVELVREFSKPDSRIKILASVSALAKGFDVQDIGCLIDARPLRKSLSEVIQMWGRGLRSSPQTGKTGCIVLSFSGNIRRFYDDFTDVYFDGFGTLDCAEKLDRKTRQEPEDFAPSGCPQCHHKPFRRRCLACGYEKHTQALTDSISGEMQEILIGKKRAAANKSDLWSQLCTYARSHLKTDKKAGWVWFKYQDITGEKPPRSFSFDSAPDVPLTPALVGKLRSMHIAFKKGRARVT